MSKTVGILGGIIFGFVGMITSQTFAYEEILSCIREEDTCNADFYKEFLKIYENFKERYDLTNGEIKTLFSDEQIQGITKVLEKKDAKKAEILHIFDIINDIQPLNDWELNALKEHDNYDKIISYIKDIEDSIDDPIDFKEYNYEARNCKIYRITYLPSAKAYISPDFKQKEYFISSKHLERYIETKNPGTCKIIQNFTLNTTFDNKGSIRFVAPNGKIYFIKQAGNQRYTEEMKTIHYYDSLNFLKAYLKNSNPQIDL